MRKIPVIIILLFLLSPAASSKIIFGIDENYPPHEFVEDGVAKGFNVDIMKAIAEEMNESIEIVPMVWEDAVKALRNGSIDTLCMAENEERRQYFSFSEPILTLKLGIFVREEMTGIDDVYALENHSVAVEGGDIAEEYLLSKHINAYIVEAASQDEAMKLLVEGEVTAFFGNYYTGIYLIQKHGYGNIKVIGREVEIGHRAIAVAKGNEQLLEKINESLASIRENGVYDEIYKRWYGMEIYTTEGVKIPRWFANLVIFITASVAFIVAAIAIWNRQLQERVEKRTKELVEYQKNLERIVEERTKEVKFLSHRLAHDLKAPLRSIRTFSSLLMDECGEKLPAEGADMLRRIERASRRMEKIIEKLMDYSRIDNREVMRKKIDVNMLLKDVIAEMEDEIRKRGADIVMDVIPSVRADPEIMKDVLHNLIHNAVKFVPPGRKPKVRIYGKRVDGRVRIYVEDNGIGVPADKRKEIFSLFTRLHGRDEYEGTGVGLAIVKKGVEKMGGKVGIKDREGGGSIFWVELPGR